MGAYCAATAWVGEQDAVLAALVREQDVVLEWALTVQQRCSASVGQGGIRIRDCMCACLLNRQSGSCVCVCVSVCVCAVVITNIISGCSQTLLR
jgi:hypothetical protein